MIQAKLAGTKTQTRRIIKESFNGCLTGGGPHPCPNDPIVYYPGEVLPHPENEKKTITVDFPQVRAIFHCSTLEAEAKCRFGKPGDVLYARETWKEYYDPHGHPHEPIFVFKADAEWEGALWRPAIHMPKSIARIWEEVISIRVERLQDISEQDAIAEGVYQYTQLFGRLGKTVGCFHDYSRKGRDFYSAKDSYKTLWESINGPGSWDVNPWVWVIDTKVLSTTGKPASLK